MPRRLPLTLFLLAVALSPWQQGPTAQHSLAAGNSCLQCHAARQDGFSPAHSFAATGCVTCHAGNNNATVEADAHAGLIAFPGELENAQRACGSCHANRVASVAKHLMHTASGMVLVTRKALDESVGPDDAANLQTLGHGVADSVKRRPDTATT